VRNAHLAALALLAASYTALLSGLVGQAIWGGRVIEPAVAIFAWLRLAVEIVRFRIAKHEDLSKHRAGIVGIVMWLAIAVFVTLALNTTLIVGE
jgi:hypothetical protein